MYKVEFIATGHVFELPEIVAKELKEKYPEEYKILEKNGKKFKDKIKKKVCDENSKSIYSNCTSIKSIKYPHEDKHCKICCH